MLTGKIKPNTTFSKDDHRLFNRHGDSYRGETFSGLDYETGLKAVEEFQKRSARAGMTLTQFALRWI